MKYKDWLDVWFANYPKRGELKRVDSITLHNGGNAMTAAVNLKKLGIDTYMVGKIGNDFFGKYLTECFMPLR